MSEEHRKRVRIAGQEKFGPGKDKNEFYSKRVQRSLKLFRGEKVLDVGTERGVIAKHLMELGFDVYAIDVNEVSVKKARKKGVNAIKLDVETEKLPFPKKFFDTVWAGEVVEHLLDPDFFFEEVDGVLKDDGVFIFTVPNVTSFKNKIRVLLGFMPQFACCYSSLDHGHMRDYNLDEANLLVSKHNFKITKVLADKITINRINLGFLAKIIPTWGDILIIRAEKSSF